MPGNIFWYTRSGESRTNNRMLQSLNNEKLLEYQIKEHLYISRV